MSETDTNPQPRPTPELPETELPKPDVMTPDHNPGPDALPPRRAGLVPLVLGGAIAAVIGYGLAQVVPDGWPIADTEAIAAAQADLTRRLTDTETALAGSRAQAADLAAQVEGLAGQLANQPAAPAAQDLGPLDGRIAALEDQVQGITALPAGEGPANAALAAQVAALQGQVQRLAEAPAAAAANPAADAATGAAVTEALAEAQAGAEALRRAGALDRLSAALQTGTAYADVLPALGDGLPEALTAPAETGVPTTTALLDAFPEAARAALAAAVTEQAQAGGWSDRALAFLQMQTGARSVTAREGDSPDAILSRAEAALRAGRLAEAVTEVEALPETAAAAMADWLAQARTTLAAREALSQLQEG